MKTERRGRPKNRETLITEGVINPKNGKEVSHNKAVKLGLAR